MLGNIWLKIKVFFLITIILALLSFLFFMLVDKLAQNINLQNGAENSFRYLEQRVKNSQYERITAAFGLTAKVKVEYDRKGRKSAFDTSAVDPKALFAILDHEGTVVAGTFNAQSSLAGVPAVDRAIRDGVASDGMVRANNDILLIGVVPYTIDLNGAQKRYIAVSMIPLRDTLAAMQLSFPARVYANETMIYEFNKNDLLAIMGSDFRETVQAAVDQAVLEGQGRPVSRWCRVAAFTMPHDIRSSEKITFVGILSSVPGYDLYRRITLYIGLYAAIAIFVTLIFTMLITYDIDRGFKKLAADVSRLRVGEKLLLHKYSHGAGLVVAALNHLIGTYQKHGETGGGGMLSSLIPEKEDPDMVEIPEPSFDRKREPMAPVGNGNGSGPKPAEPAAPAPEKSEPVAAADPFAELWDTYRGIKVKNGEQVADQEKAALIAKLKTNRVSIMNKYNCRDVVFSIEEKDGKPVIKAKPVK